MVECVQYTSIPHTPSSNVRGQLIVTPPYLDLIYHCQHILRIPSYSEDVQFFSPLVYCFWLDVVLAIKWTLYPSMLKGERNTCNVCIRLTMWHIHITTVAITQQTFPLYWCWPNVAVNHVKLFSVDTGSKQWVPFCTAVALQNISYWCQHKTYLGLYANCPAL